MKVFKHKKFQHLYNVKSAITINNYYIFFIKNGKCHNSKYHALIDLNQSVGNKNPKYYRKFFYFNNTRYDSYSIKCWQKQTKYLKRELNLKVFK